MKKEEAVERIMDLQREVLISAGAGLPVLGIYKDKLTAILTELMHPIGEEEIREWAALKTGNVITDCSENYYNGVIDGAKWAATRNLKVSLEGLKVYMTPVALDENRGYMADSYLKSDVKKLVG